MNPQVEINTDKSFACDTPIKMVIWAKSEYRDIFNVENVDDLEECNIGSSSSSNRQTNYLCVRMKLKYFYSNNPEEGKIIKSMGDGANVLVCTSIKFLKPFENYICFIL